MRFQDAAIRAEDRRTRTTALPSLVDAVSALLLLVTPASLSPLRAWRCTDAMVIAAEGPPPPHADAAAALLVLRAVAALANAPAATTLPSPGDVSATWTRAEAVATLRAATRVSRAWRAFAAEAAEALTTLALRDPRVLADGALARCHPRATTLCLSRLRPAAARELLLRDEPARPLGVPTQELDPPQPEAPPTAAVPETRPAHEGADDEVRTRSATHAGNAGTRLRASAACSLRCVTSALFCL